MVGTDFPYYWYQYSYKLLLFVDELTPTSQLRPQLNIVLGNIYMDSRLEVIERTSGNKYQMNLGKK